MSEREQSGDGAAGPLAFLADDSECAKLIRGIDWAATPLGHPSTWSASLGMVTRFVLANRFPHLLSWGPEYVQIYNDPYIPVLGNKHPGQAMGKPVRECWHEVYHLLAPLVDTPFNGGPATWLEDFELIVQRHGFAEESQFTVAYSAVPDEAAPRGIGGVLATMHEISQKVIGERRVKLLSELGGLAEAKSADEACTLAAGILARHPKDVPFALCYLFDETKSELRLVAATGIAPELQGPAVLDATGPMREAVWPLAEALRTDTLQTLSGLAAHLPFVPQGPWPDAPDTVAVLPIKSNVSRRPAGALVVGISACIRLDALYTSFLELVAAQIATAVANARAYEEERRRAEALAEIDRAKTAFFSNVSHEFRTPLTLMLGPLEDALAATDEPPRLRGQLEVAQRNALRLLKL